MQPTISIAEREEDTQWVESPVTMGRNHLLPDSTIHVRPYFGRKRQVHLHRTEYLIGRDSVCDIRLEDPYLSPRHALLKLSPGGKGYFLEDLSSRNGTFLNGVRVQRAHLPISGVLKVGRSAFSWSRPGAFELPENSPWISADPFLKEQLEKLRKIANSNLPVLLLGETGTGKEILAKMIHDWSTKREREFVALNGGLTGGGLADSELFGHRKGAYTGGDFHRQGAIRLAQGGTLFLDEIADVPMETQIKLLRTLETGEYRALGNDLVEFSDFRLVTATSQNLEQKISTKHFRLDFFYRIAGFVFSIPPLRDRPTDILAIGNALLEKKGFELDKAAEGKLLSNKWHGNVRELKGVLDRAMILAKEDCSGTILPEHIHFQHGRSVSLEIKDKLSSPRTMDEVERELIEISLERNAWSRNVVAKELGIARSTLFEKMKKYGIKDRSSLEL